MDDEKPKGRWMAREESLFADLYLDIAKSLTRKLFISPATASQRAYHATVSANKRDFAFIRAVTAVEGVRPELSFRIATFKTTYGLSSKRHECGAQGAGNALLRMNLDGLAD